MSQAQASDYFARKRPESPAMGSYQPTPSDSADLPDRRWGVLQVLQTATAGQTVSFVGVDGQTDTWAVSPGDLIPVVVRRVRATGTTVPAASLRVLVL